MVGVPDVKFGEELCAWIRLKDGDTATPEEIKQFCKGQIAHYKIPRYIKFVQDFPMTASGKIQKFIDSRSDDQGTGPHRGGDGLKQTSWSNVKTALCVNLGQAGNSGLALS